MVGGAGEDAEGKEMFCVASYYYYGHILHLCRGAYGRTSSRRYQTLYRSIFDCCTGYRRITGVNACQGMMYCK